ncbi:hypothetical protein [Actinokineospora globicatena]|uniref:hypothetical protein n=1 Tax=Actinokineospora globicatena TaxID=103729 RepID=UPI0020A27993|nr:hypothetical protein [Actinokineospora globicatena]MCP2306614.1 hypothetical protein [Actinokineospora globicatena]GLW82048.1 hypothetical protein Aglo01_65290 [Actinokineospora globicatena]GLW88842.1 hypothetical protein Aglo02_64810 [Actinokineospora globicatena]
MERTKVRTATTTAVVLLLGALLTLTGLTWDVQWHEDVGPDTFFTLPHLFLYAGSAVSGIASLTAVLMTTAARRAGHAPDPTVGGVPVGVFGRTFTAPLGYLVAGSGAALFLLYGLWDQWWHGIYGFDAVIDSPPHVGLLLSIAMTLVGSVVVFGAARDQPWGRTGVFVSLAVLAGFSTIIAVAFQDVSDTVDSMHVAMAFLVLLTLFTGAGFVRKGGIAVAIGLALVQALSWWFSPWATRLYADSVGLPMRDYISGVPTMPALMPMTLIIVALLTYPVIGLAARWAPLVAGALAGALVVTAQAFQDGVVYDVPAPAVGDLLPTILAAAVLGLLAGHLGARFGQMLRLAAGDRPEGV